MNKTKEVIRRILENYQVERLRSLPNINLIHWLISEFGVSRGIAYNIKNNLKRYSADSLYFIYFPELRRFL